MYVVAVTEVVYDEEFLIQEMLKSGEYGINAHPISHEAMLEFIRDREWGLGDVEQEYLDKWNIPVEISIKDEDGETLYHKSNGLLI